MREVVGEMLVSESSLLVTDGFEMDDVDDAGLRAEIGECGDELDDGDVVLLLAVVEAARAEAEGCGLLIKVFMGLNWLLLGFNLSSVKSGMCKIGKDWLSCCWREDMVQSEINACWN